VGGGLVLGLREMGEGDRANLNTYDRPWWIVMDWVAIMVLYVVKFDEQTL
jgi:hypothetical protein